MRWRNSGFRRARSRRPWRSLTLGGEVQRAQHLQHVVVVVAQAKVLPNECGDAPAAPELALEARRLGLLHKGLHQLALLTGESRGRLPGAGRGKRPASPPRANRYASGARCGDWRPLARNLGVAQAWFKSTTPRRRQWKSSSGLLLGLMIITAMTCFIHSIMRGHLLLKDQ